jgi:excisionase family DNA binding protein
VPTCLRGVNNNIQIICGIVRFLSFGQLGGFVYIMVKEAAARLKVSRQWVNTLINNGKISTAILAGRRVVIADKAFIALEKARRKVGK